MFGLLVVLTILGIVGIVTFALYQGKNIGDEVEDEGEASYRNMDEELRNLGYDPEKFGENVRSRCGTNERYRRFYRRRAGSTDLEFNEDLLEDFIVLLVAEGLLDDEWDDEVAEGVIEDDPEEVALPDVPTSPLENVVDIPEEEYEPPETLDTVGEAFRSVLSAPDPEPMEVGLTDDLETRRTWNEPATVDYGSSFSDSGGSDYSSSDSGGGGGWD